MNRIVAVLMLLPACGGGSVAPAPEPVEAPAGEADHAGAHQHMKAHFESLTKARDAVIAGDLEAARAPLTWLAEHDPPKDLPEGWPPHVDAMQAAARKAAASKKPVELARGLGKIAVTCGECHTQLGKGPTYAATAPPAEGGDAKQHMRRHQWAADRMWEGLVAGDAATWAAGAEVMREAHLETLEGGDAEEVKELAAKVHEMGSTALDSVAPYRRAVVYGDFIATCGTCHTETGKGPAE